MWAVECSPGSARWTRRCPRTDPPADRRVSAGCGAWEAARARGCRVRRPNRPYDSGVTMRDGFGDDGPGPAADAVPPWQAPGPGATAEGAYPPPVPGTMARGTYPQPVPGTGHRANPGRRRRSAAPRSGRLVRLALVAGFLAGA